MESHFYYGGIEAQLEQVDTKYLKVDIFHVSEAIFIVCWVALTNSLNT